MERSTAPLAYKGSISDAIVEAQRQKKLFVVYISGEDENSNNLETSTWVDVLVVESIPKYCIFLHLIQESLEASQFSAIYPQKSVPSISAVGYNGLLLWQHEGYIDAETLVGSIEKAWATLHLQETAATFLSATLASDNPEPLGSSSHNVRSVESEVPSTSEVLSTSTKKPVENPEAQQLPTDSKQLEEQKHDDQKATKSDEETCSDIKVNSEEQSNPESYSHKEVQCSMSRDVYSGTCNAGDASIEPQENPSPDGHHLITSAAAEEVIKCSPEPEPSQTIAKEVDGSNQAKKFEKLTEGSNAVKSNDIHLHIRLPNGTSLQVKFTVSDTLKSVKNYIDEKNTAEIGSYDLAVPYPRKVFNEQEMNTSMSDLGFGSREALIVVPRPRHQVSSNANRSGLTETDSSSSGGGYFQYLRSMLSYVNPFSYLGGRTDLSNSGTSPNQNLWEYRPNPELQNHLSGAGSSRRRDSLTNQTPQAGDNASNTRRRTSRPFGSNIHTLRENEDDAGPSDDRNTFWNGNSTQYGGNDK